MAAAYPFRLFRFSFSCREVKAHDGFIDREAARAFLADFLRFNASQVVVLFQDIDHAIYYHTETKDFYCDFCADSGTPSDSLLSELRARLLECRADYEKKQAAQRIQEADGDGCAYEVSAAGSRVLVERDTRNPGKFRATWFVGAEIDERRNNQTAEEAAALVWLFCDGYAAQGEQLETARPHYSPSAKSENPAPSGSPAGSPSATVPAGSASGKNEPAALLKRYQERKQKLLAIGYPYYSRLKNEDGSFNIPTSDESTYWDYAAGVITFEEAARELCRCGFTNFVDEKYTRTVFARINERLHKLDDDLRPIKAAA